MLRARSLLVQDQSQAKIMKELDIILTNPHELTRSHSVIKDEKCEKS